eukprot:scaffold2911_cov414-Prasinococcus_capsulatus_cf.AAC.33
MVGAWLHRARIFRDRWTALSLSKESLEGGYLHNRSPGWHPVVPPHFRIFGHNASTNHFRYLIERKGPMNALGVGIVPFPPRTGSVRHSHCPAASGAGEWPTESKLRLASVVDKDATCADIPTLAGARCVRARRAAYQRGA